MSDKKKKRVIIMGAGPAGLTMAYELLKEGGNKKFDVVILEGSKDIGGISKTVKYNGNRMDIGGHRFFSKDDRVMKFWSDLMPIQGKNSFDDEVLGRKKPLVEGGPNPEKDDDVMLIRRRVSRIYSFKKFLTSCSISCGLYESSRIFLRYSFERLYAHNCTIILFG